MRAIWNGAISFGLIYIPVRLYSASKDRSLDLDWLRKDDLCPVGYAYICKSTGERVERDQIVKGYKYEDGDYVVLSDDDLKKANIAKSKTIQVRQFVEETEIEATYLDKPYYLAPQKGAEKVYALLKEALQRTGKVAIAQFVLRTKEHLAMLKAQDDLIILNQMRYQEEIRPTDELPVPKDAQVSEQELALATQLIDQLSKPFTPEAYKDTYTEELKDLIEEKAEGRVPVAKGEAPQATQVDELLAKLEQSLKQARQGQGDRPRVVS